MANEVKAEQIGKMVTAALDNWDFDFARADARAILYDMAANPVITAAQLNDWLTAHPNRAAFEGLVEMVEAAP